MEQHSDSSNGETYCHINECDESVQYFAVSDHAVRETHNNETRCTLTFICKNKRRSTMQQFASENICRVAYKNCRATESLCSAIKKI